MGFTLVMVLVVVRLLVTVVVAGMMVASSDVWKGVGDEILVMLDASSVMIFVKEMVSM